MAELSVYIFMTMSGLNAPNRAKINAIVRRHVIVIPYERQIPSSSFAPQYCEKKKTSSARKSPVTVEHQKRKLPAKPDSRHIPFAERRNHHRIDHTSCRCEKVLKCNWNCDDRNSLYEVNPVKFCRNCAFHGFHYNKNST